MNDPLITIAHFCNRFDTAPKTRILAWDALASGLQRFQTRETKDGPLWSPVTYLEGSRRANDNVLMVHCGVLDFDHDITLDRLIDGTGGYHAVIHSTYSHTPQNPRYRVVLPLAVPVPGRLWPLVWQKLNRLFEERADKSAKDAARMHYLPACSAKMRQFMEYHRLDGEFLNVKSLPPLPIPPPTPEELAPLPVFVTNREEGARKYALAALQGEADKLRRAPDGSKHFQLRSSGIAVGGFVARGLISRDEAVSALYGSIAGRARSQRTARQTSEWSVDAGAARPRDVPSSAALRQSY